MGQKATVRGPEVLGTNSSFYQSILPWDPGRKVLTKESADVQMKREFWTATGRGAGIAGVVLGSGTLNINILLWMFPAVGMKQLLGFHFCFFFAASCFKGFMASRGSRLKAMMIFLLEDACT